MDKRRNYYMMLDGETTNGLEQPLNYDIGGCIVDKNGKVYEKFSFVIYEIFSDNDLMASAYFADKIPQYRKDINEGKRRIVRLATAKKHIRDLCKEYKVKAIVAHNAKFDYDSTNNTQRFVSCSKYRYFLPYGIPIYDTLAMARDTIVKQKGYISFCEENGYLTTYGKPSATAENLYRYISGKHEFSESHTGLEDCLIEKEIFAHCLRQHKKMKMRLFSGTKRKV